MAFPFPSSLDEFRAEVHAFLAANLPTDLRSAVLEHRSLKRDEHLRWHGILARHGWVAPHWPQHHGGTGWSPLQMYLFHYECAMAGAPELLPFGVKMIGPVLIEYGTPEQQARYLPRILSGEDWWCQGYSEPNAGSDLAALRLQAQRRGEFFVLNGQKTWTSYAQHANLMFCLARTDPEAQQQRGISFLIVDMKSPGITVRPIITLDGEHEVNEVFFDEVSVPAGNLVGELHRGWDCAKFLLRHERFPMSGIARVRKELNFVRRVCADRCESRDAPPPDAGLARRVAALEAEVSVLEFTLVRAIFAAQAGQDVGATTSLLKIKCSDLLQQATELTLDALGPHALLAGSQAAFSSHVGSVTCATPFDPPPDWQAIATPRYAQNATPFYLNMRKMTIFGGSNEIQRNILAKSFLGL